MVFSVASVLSREGMRYDSPPDGEKISMGALSALVALVAISLSMVLSVVWSAEKSRFLRSFQMSARYPAWLTMTCCVAGNGSPRNGFKTLFVKSAK